MALTTMRELLIEELRDIYHAERQLVRALSQMAQAARTRKLHQAFEHHLEETRRQVLRLEQAFESMDVRPNGKRCDPMDGLIDWAKEMIEAIETPDVLDAALIASAQKIEHYEIASYGSVRELALALGEAEIAKLLGESLAEEKQAARMLSSLATSGIHRSALAAAA